MSRITLQNRRKNKTIFSDTVNICLESLKKDEHYYVSRMIYSKNISPLAGRLSIKLAGYMKEIIKEIEAESSIEHPIIKSDQSIFVNDDENEEFARDDDTDFDQEDNKDNLRQQLNPLLNVLIEEDDHLQQNNEESTSENITLRDPLNGPSAIKIDSIKTFKNKQLLSRRFFKRPTCPKAIPLKKNCQILKTTNANVNKGKQQVLKQVDESSSSTVADNNSSPTINMENITPHVVINEIPVQHSSPSSSGSTTNNIKTNNVTKSIYIAQSSDDDDEDNITLVVNQKSNEANKTNNIQSNDELEEFEPDDSVITNTDTRRLRPRKTENHISFKTSQQSARRITRSTTRLSEPTVKYKLCSSSSSSSSSSCGDEKSVSLSTKSNDESDTLSTTKKKNVQVKRTKRRSLKTPKTNEMNKKLLAETVIFNPTWTLFKAKQYIGYKGIINNQDLQSWTQRRIDVDKLNQFIYKKCIEFKNENSKITDDRIDQLVMQVKNEIFPKDFRLSCKTWRNEFFKKYNISGKPSDRKIN